jgi:two-component system chemotaxis response regulator CheY
MSETRLPQSPPDPLKVLVVDDSGLTRTMVRRSLGMYGTPMDVVEAVDGQEALDRLQNGPFDLCFLDLNMPRVSGVQVAQWANASPDVQTRVIIVSSESMSQRIEQLREANVAAYVRKPFTPEQIRDILDQVLGTRAAA